MTAMTNAERQRKWYHAHKEAAHTKNLLTNALRTKEAATRYERNKRDRFTELKSRDELERLLRK